MAVHDIDRTMEQYLANGELSGGSLIVRKKGAIVYRNKWGYSDVSTKKAIEYDSIYRMMSMTKPVVAVAILKLMEQGRLSVDDPLAKYIPAFADMHVAADRRYAFSDGMKTTDVLKKLMFFKMSKVKNVPAERQITLRDLLSHASGLAQGVVGLLAMIKDKRTHVSLAQQAELYSSYVLDFQPGTSTGYSPLAGFDLLARVVEICSGKSADEYIREEIFSPLGMMDSFFGLDDERQKRLVSVYKRTRNNLKDVTGTKDDMDGMLHRGKGYIAGSGGLFSTVEDYERFAAMLCNGGCYGGARILSSETVDLMRTEAAKAHLEPWPGLVWGLGVLIRQQPDKANSPATEGTYGWSGAFGTHFFVSPHDELDCVWVTNRTDLGGSASYISKRVEELVFETFVR